MYKSTKIKTKMTKHAEKRLFERFGLKCLPKIYQKDVEWLGTVGGRVAFYHEALNLIFIRNNKSHRIVTFLTTDMWRKE